MHDLDNVQKIINKQGYYYINGCVVTGPIQRIITTVAPKSRVIRNLRRELQEHEGHFLTTLHKCKGSVYSKTLKEALDVAARFVILPE